MWSLLGQREPKFCENGLGHMTKVAAMPIIYMAKLFCRTQSPMILKHVMSNKRLNLYKVCINDDPGLTLTYFKVKFGCLYTRIGKMLESHLMGKPCSRENDV